MDPLQETPSRTLGEFRTLAVLGQGGSGIVYDAAWGPRRVALKVLHPSLVDGERVRAQFLAEAQRLQTISHPSVVKVLSTGVLPDGRPFLAMERLEGETLAEVLARGPLALPHALALFGELCGAVAALHAQGLVHRDLKPENVFIVRTPEGTQHAVLLDFGIAKDLMAPASTTTIDGGVRGTPAYMAPERFFGQPAGVATDIYELAVTLYAMLAGRLPWDDLADPEARLSPRPLVELAPVVGELDIEIRRALSTRAQNRPPSATALYEAVRTAAGADAPAPAETARMKPAASEPSPVTSAPTPINVTRDARPWFADRQATTDRGRTPLAWAPTEAAPHAPEPVAKKRRWPLIVAGVAAAGIAGGAVWLGGVGRGGEEAKVATVADDTAPKAVVTHDEKPEPKPKAKPDVVEEDGDASETTATEADSKDPWASPGGGGRTKKPSTSKHSFVPALEGPELPVATARKEVAAAIQKVPADTQVLMSAIVGDMRRHDQFKNVLDKIAKHPRVTDLVDTVPCMRAIATGSEWVVFAAPSLESGHHGTLIVRGRWRRADIEKCLDHDTQPLKMSDGTALLQMPRLGWIDFIDDHTVYLSVREDLAAAQVRDLVRGGKGPKARVKELLAKLPAERTLTAIVDGSGGMVWPEKRIPKGSDATAWFHLPDEGNVPFDFTVDTKDATAAQGLVDVVKPQLDDLFKDGAKALVGDIEAVRKGDVFYLRGALTPFVMGMIASMVP